MFSGTLSLLIFTCIIAQKAVSHALYFTYTHSGDVKKMKSSTVMCIEVNII